MAEASKRRELDRLLARLVDGDAADDDMAALEHLLDGDAEAQRRYVHYIDLHLELLARSESGQNGRIAELSCAEPSKLRWKQVIAVVTVATLLIAVGMRIGQSTGAFGIGDVPVIAESLSESVMEPTDNGVAVLTRAVGVDWVTPSAPESGAILSPGELKLSSGVIQIEFYNGVQLIVEGPANLEIESVARIICREGQLRSYVPPHAIGFTVLTPKFELVDLGTEFAVDVAADGRSDVHVFDGEVELYQPDGERDASQKQLLTAGNALGWSASGSTMSRAVNPEAFASFEDVRARDRLESQKRFAEWQRRKHSLRDDPRIVARYDFEADGPFLIDAGPAKSHGTIVGCEWTTGRWPDKQALEFKRPGDRVRVDIPGEFDALTVAAWARVAALPSHHQALLLTDGHQAGHLHWQIRPDGGLRMSSRNPPQLTNEFYLGHSSPPVFQTRQIGVWNFVCSTYDCVSGMSVHWFNGEPVSNHTVVGELPIQIGAAEIGNWSLPTWPVEQPVRNFVGRMDELTVWGTALQPDEIREIYSNTQP